VLAEQQGSVYREVGSEGPVDRSIAGIDKVRAWKSATNGRDPWWNGAASHMNQAFPKSWFGRKGLVSLVDTHRRFLSVS